MLILSPLLLFFILFFPYQTSSSPTTPCSCKLNGFPTTKIINGTLVLPHEFPWLVTLNLLLKNGKYHHFCGGTLINSRWVLTAAHCQGLDIQKVFVGVGYHRLSEEGKKYSVIRSISHPSYSTTPLVYNDLGLFELNETVRFTDQVYPACLSETDQFVYRDELIVAGWGVINESDRKLTDVPMQAKLTQTNFFRCYYDWFGFLSYQSHLCGYQTTQSACFGDSGGALMAPIDNHRRVKVVGIVSFGSDCHSTKPTVFTKVSSYHNWIKSQAGEYCVDSKRSDQLVDETIAQESISTEEVMEVETVASVGF